MCWNTRTFSAASGISCLRSRGAYIYCNFITQKKFVFQVKVPFVTE